MKWWVTSVGSSRTSTAGTRPLLPPDGGPEDLWHVTMFPVAVSEDDEGQVVPDARVDVLAVQQMLDDCDDVALTSDGTVEVSGTKNKVLVQLNLRCFPPDDVESGAEK